MSALTTDDKRRLLVEWLIKQRDAGAVDGWVPRRLLVTAAMETGWWPRGMVDLRPDLHALEVAGEIEKRRTWEDFEEPGITPGTTIWFRAVVTVGGGM